MKCFIWNYFCWRIIWNVLLKLVPQIMFIHNFVSNIQNFNESWPICMLFPYGIIIIWGSVTTERKRVYHLLRTSSKLFSLTSKAVQSVQCADVYSTMDDDRIDADAASFGGQPVQTSYSYRHSTGKHNQKMSIFYFNFACTCLPRLRVENCFLIMSRKPKSPY